MQNSNEPENGIYSLLGPLTVILTIVVVGWQLYFSGHFSSELKSSAVQSPVTIIKEGKIGLTARVLKATEKEIVVGFFKVKGIDGIIISEQYPSKENCTFLGAETIMWNEGVSYETWAEILVSTAKVKGANYVHTVDLGKPETKTWEE
jgi:hypothetical protein